MNSNTISFLFLLFFTIPICTASRFWKYLENLGLEKLSSLLYTASRKLKQQPTKQEEEKSGYFHFDVDMNNISYYMPESTIKELIKIKKRCLGFNKAIILPYFFLKRQLLVAKKSIEASIKIFNNSYDEKLIMSQDEQNIFHIAWQQETNSWFDVKKTRINELYMFLEQYKTNFTQPDAKLLIIHKKWTAIQSMFTAKDDKSLDKIITEFKKFVLSKLSTIAWVTSSSPKNIDLFGNEDLDTISLILSQDHIEKKICNLFSIYLATEISDQTIQGMLQTYNSLLQETLKYLLIRPDIKQAADIKNFIANKKEQKLFNLYEKLNFISIYVILFYPKIPIQEF